MDQCVKLEKLIHSKCIDQFSTHLGRSSTKLKPRHFALLLFQVLTLQSCNHHQYIIEILKYEVDVNLIYTNKDRLPRLAGKTPLMIACQSSDFATVNALLGYKNTKLTLTDSQQQNLLFYALRNQSEEESYQIIRAVVGMDQTLINTVNSQGNSLLFNALESQSLRIVQLLLKNSADPNFKCKKTGSTALHKSLLNSTCNPEKKKDLVLLLLNYNADPLIQNGQGKSAFDIAKQVGLELDWLDEPNQESENQEISEQVNICCHKQINSLTKQDDNSVIDYQNISQSVESEDSDEPFSVENLSQEILIFAKNCEKKYIDSWKDVEMMYNELDKIGTMFHLKIDIIGSYATGLWTSSSDIDIVFTNSEPNHIEIEAILGKIYQILKLRTSQLGIKEIYLNKNNNGNCFPNIKIDLQAKYHSRKIDITIFQKKNNGQKYVRFIRDKLNENTLIKPVFFALHRLLKSFGLSNPAKNGIKTYAIFLMLLISFEALKTESIGQFFINTIYYYSYCFPYESSLNTENVEVIHQFNIYDPLNNYNNVGGRKTDVNRLREMFRTADYGLRLAGGKNILEYMFSLHNIFSK